MQAGHNTYRVGDTDQRPWGSWSVIAAGARFAAKEIIVKPGQKLSLQRHRMRDEHWIVVAGAAHATLNGEPRMLAQNESAFIKAGSIHRLENHGTEDLVLIEVQYGEWLDEADIERLQDSYGRVT